MRPSMLWNAAVLVALGAGGCVIDDTGGSRGQQSTLSASVPDSGNPVRRESAAKTLNEARPAPPQTGDGSTLEVEPAPGRTPPPPPVE